MTTCGFSSGLLYPTDGRLIIFFLLPLFTVGAGFPQVRIYQHQDRQISGIHPKPHFISIGQLQLAFSAWPSGHASLSIHLFAFTVQHWTEVDGKQRFLHLFLVDDQSFDTSSKIRITVQSVQ